MNDDILYTRGEFLKTVFAAVAVLLVGGLISNTDRVSRAFRRAGPNAYGNSVYGGRT